MMRRQKSDLGRIPQLCIKRCKAQKLSCRAKRPRMQVNFLSAPWNIALLGCRWDCHSVCKSCMYLSVVWTSWGSPLAWSPWGSPGPALYWWWNQGLSLFPFCWGILNRKDHLTEDPYWVLILESKRQIQKSKCLRKHFCSYFFGYENLSSAWDCIPTFRRALWEHWEWDHPCIGVFHQAVPAGWSYSLTKFLKVALPPCLCHWVIPRHILLFAFFPLSSYYPPPTAHSLFFSKKVKNH